MSDNCSMGTAQAPNKKGEYSYTADRRERPLFRLIDHWKRESISGSFRIGNKFRFQAHSTIGKCSYAPVGRFVSHSTWRDNQSFGRAGALPNGSLFAIPLRFLFAE